MAFSVALPTITTTYPGPTDAQTIKSFRFYRDARELRDAMDGPTQDDSGFLTPLRNVGLMPGDNPDSFEDVKSTAGLRLMMGNHAEVLLMLLARRDLVEQDAIASEILGASAGELELRDLAVHAFGVAAGLSPDIPSMRLNYARSLRMHGDKKIAEKEFLEAIRLRPADSRSHSEFMEMLLEEGQFERVVSHASQILESVLPANATMLCMRGIARRALNQNEDAKRDFEAAVLLDKDCTLALYQQFAMAISSNQLDLATELARKLFINI